MRGLTGRCGEGMGVLGASVVAIGVSVGVGARSAEVGARSAEVGARSAEPGASARGLEGLVRERALDCKIGDQRQYDEEEGGLEQERSRLGAALSQRT